MLHRMTIIREFYFVDWRFLMFLRTTFFSSSWVKFNLETNFCDFLFLSNKNGTTFSKFSGCRVMHKGVTQHFIGKWMFQVSSHSKSLFISQNSKIFMQLCFDTSCFISLEGCRYGEFDSWPDQKLENTRRKSAENFIHNCSWSWCWTRAKSKSPLAWGTGRGMITDGPFK